MDRTKSGVIVVEGDSINVNSQAVIRNADGSIDLHIYVDRSSVEVFTKNYTVAGAMQIFASPVSQGLSVYSKGGNTTGDITVYPLKSIWRDKITPTKPTAVGLDKTSFNGYVGDEFTLNGWVSPSEVSQDIVYSVDNDSVVSLVQDGNKATITALNSGIAIVTAASATDPSVKKECVVQVRENNFKTNLTDFKAISGNWYIDGESYYGSHNDNAFLFANELNTDEFKYEIDATYKSGMLNFIFQSQTTNVWDGSYALQLNGKTVRLFDFKGDYTFTSTDTLVRPEDNQYHIEINVKGNNIVATVNGVEYINYNITEEDINQGHQYSNGYVGLGLYDAAASYQNFYVVTDELKVSVFNGESDKAEYTYYDSRATATVTAEKVDGKEFLYWVNEYDRIISYKDTYSFIVVNNTTLKAVYGTEGTTVTKEPSIVMDPNYIKTIVDSKYRLSFNGKLFLPEGYELVEYGMLYTPVAEPDKDGFVIDGSVSPMQKLEAKNINSEGQFVINVNNIKAGVTRSGRMYMIYKDADGNEKTIYSEEISKTGILPAIN